MMRRGYVCLIVLALCVTIVPAQEAEPGPISWLAFSKVKPGKTREAVEMSMLGAELMKKLIDEGKVLSWGVATPINHRPGQDWNHVEWATLPNWAAVGDWAGAVMADMQAMDPKEMASREARGEEIYVEGSHYDQVVRHFKVSPGASAPQYLYLAHFDANPGRQESLTAVLGEIADEMAGPLKSSGAFTSYGGYTQEIHGAPGATSHTLWFGLRDLGSVDRLSDAVSSGDEARVGMLTSSHHDTILMILHQERP